MKTLGKIRAMLAVIAALAVMCCSVAFAAESDVDWETNLITVQGMGSAPNAPNEFLFRAQSKRAATVDAYRNLLESVKGVEVEGGTTINNLMLDAGGDTVSTHVKGVVNGARVVDTQYVNGGCIVTVQMPIFGSGNSLAKAVMPRNTSVESFPAPVKNVEPTVTAVRVNVAVGNNVPLIPAQPTQVAPKGRAYGQYTGLIVDCRGLGLSPCMSPVLRDDGGTPIYGYKNIDPDKVNEVGMVAYTSNPANARRAGSDP